MLRVPKPQKPSKKHHFVPQAQLRHFANDDAGRSIWVYDKVRDRSWQSSLLNAGSENDFNTVSYPGGNWNFEDLFQGVDGRTAALITKILSTRELGWMKSTDHVAMIDMFTTQMLRTKLARTTIGSLAGQLRAMVQSIGLNPDDDPQLVTPSEAAIRMGAVKSFLERDEMAMSLGRLIPVLFAASEGQRFIISDDPVVRSNAFPYGDAGLKSHGIIVSMPISSNLLLALLCPTIISRYEATEQIEMTSEMRQRMLRYREGFTSGRPITIDAEEIENWNRHQVSGSALQLYGAAQSDFDFARQMLMENPELRAVETRVKFGEIGRGLPTKSGIPSGWQLVINGKFDHAILSIVEIDEAGESLTARTKNLELLELIAADPNEVRADLYRDGQPRRSISQAQVERFGVQSDGWFRVVHRDAGLRNLLRQIDASDRS